MKINQLFIKKIDDDLLTKVLDCFNLRSLNDMHMFSRKELEQSNVVEKLNALVPDLQQYYLNCKSTIYLNNLTSKKTITILKQILRLYDYSLVSIEKNINSRKVIYYQLSKNNSNPSVNIKIISKVENVELKFT